MEAALRSGLMARGVPGAILVDRVGVRVLAAAQGVRGAGREADSRQPSRGDDEGQDREILQTVRDRFMVEIDDGVELPELNRLCSAWLEVVYHRRVHSETGQAPLERFDAGGAPPLPTPALLREAFLWSQERMVTKTATVSLHGNQYEVDPALAGRKVELVFDPVDLTRIEVRYQHRPFGTAVPLVIGRHTHPLAQQELPQPPAPTGIDYLKLLAEKRDAEPGGQRIDYASLANDGDANDGDADGDRDGDRDGEDRDINQQEDGQ